MMQALLRHAPSWRWCGYQCAHHAWCVCWCLRECGQRCLTLLVAPQLFLRPTRALVMHGVHATLAGRHACENCLLTLLEQCLHGSHACVHDLQTFWTNSQSASDVPWCRLWLQAHVHRVHACDDLQVRCAAGCGIHQEMHHVLVLRAARLRRSHCSSCVSPGMRSTAQRCCLPLTPKHSQMTVLGSF